jgi:hypothetical protein
MKNSLLKNLILDELVLIDGVMDLIKHGWRSVYTAETTILLIAATLADISNLNNTEIP